MAALERGVSRRRLHVAVKHVGLPVVGPWCGDNWRHRHRRGAPQRLGCRLEACRPAAAAQWADARRGRGARHRRRHCRRQQRLAVRAVRTPRVGPRVGRRNNWRCGRAVRRRCRLPAAHRPRQLQPRVAVWFLGGRDAGGLCARLLPRATHVCVGRAHRLPADPRSCALPRRHAGRLWRCVRLRRRRRVRSCQPPQGIGRVPPTLLHWHAAGRRGTGRPGAAARLQPRVAQRSGLRRGQLCAGGAEWQRRHADA
mmetsp:Transcript_11980/g.35339  ORF Transcript_11980/g.35339 Transcript_11980/m.35339 type:complete len:254 (+) Transcript_11980:198-959(+)